MNEPKILALDFDDTLYDTGAERLFNAAKLKQVLQAFHAANVYICIVSARSARMKILGILDKELGTDRPYLKKEDIWTPERVEELGDDGKDFEPGSGKDVIIGFVMRGYNKANPIPAMKNDVLFTDDASSHLDAVERAGYRVLRFRVESDLRGQRPEAAFLDNLYQAVIGKPLAPSLGTSRNALLAPAAGEGEPLLVRAPVQAKEDDSCCNKCVLM